MKPSDGSLERAQNWTSCHRRLEEHIPYCDAYALAIDFDRMRIKERERIASVLQRHLPDPTTALELIRRNQEFYELQEGVHHGEVHHADSDYRA